MKRIIFYIFALSMFLSCQEDTSSGFRICDGMTFSDALPVQFWLADCETYNEYEAQGVHHVCWCAPWLCTDEILVQFQDMAGQTLSLLGKTSDGEYIYESVISEIQAGVYQASFIPNDNSICDQSLQLLVGTTDAVTRVLAPSSWDDGASAFDSKSATTFGESITSADNEITATQPLVIPEGESITITYSVTVSGVWSASQGIFVSLTLRDGAAANVSTGTIPTAEKFITANGTYEFTEVLTATDTTATLRISVLETLTSGTAAFSMSVPVDQILYISDSDISAKSDCLDIATAQDETILIEYSNQRNFAGLIYENDSPDTTFKVRVPCRFFHESETEEDEAMELTSSILTTSAQAKTQRLLEVKHVPYYFHKKLRRVLKHQTVTIGSIEWKKEEQYKENEGNKRWPLKSATCLLTEKNSVVRNVL